MFEIVRGKPVIEEESSCKQCSLRHLDMYEVSDAILDGIYVTDKDGVVQAVNKNFTKITAISEAEILGRTIEDVWKDKGFGVSDDVFFILEAREDYSVPLLIDEMIQKKRAIRKPRPISALVAEAKKSVSVLTTTAFTHKTVLIIGTPYFDEVGNIKHILTIMRDLTDLLQLKGRLEAAEKEMEVYEHELNSLKAEKPFEELLGNSDAINQVKNLIKNVAKTDATILITGFTGSGKEVVAKEIVKASRRSDMPYIKINCAAIPESLLESELFGYEKGAFTGAMQKEKKGLFEIAHKGSILLDEIGEMPMPLQSKLLRVLQEREIRRIGSTDYRQVDVRVIAATNRDLLKEVKEGKFREDLYYRLNVIPITISPLRERKEDIVLLADHFLKKFNEKHHRSKYFDESAVFVLEHYDWPGNVRELENLTERLTILGDSDLIDGNLIADILGIDIPVLKRNQVVNLKEAVSAYEKQLIESALKIYTTSYKAAEALGVNQSTIVRKAAALGIKL